MTRGMQIVAAVALLVASGCSVRMDPRVPSLTGTPGRGTIGASDTVQNMPQRIGWGTFTVFAIPIAPVTVSNGPGEARLMEEIQATLKGAGYQVVEASSAGAAPVLQCDVKTFRFQNYTWLMPIIFTWGTVEVDMRLVSSQGAVIWQRSYKGEKSDASSFDDAVNSAVEQVLNAFASDVASDEFQQACCAAKTATAATVSPASP
jgi:hypothetical protein